MAMLLSLNSTRTSQLITSRLIRRRKIILSIPFKCRITFEIDYLVKVVFRPSHLPVPSNMITGLNTLRQSTMNPLLFRISLHFHLQKILRLHLPRPERDPRRPLKTCRINRPFRIVPSKSPTINNPTGQKMIANEAPFPKLRLLLPSIYLHLYALLVKCR